MRMSVRASESNSAVDEEHLADVNVIIIYCASFTGDNTTTKSCTPAYATMDPLLNVIALIFGERVYLDSCIHNYLISCIAFFAKSLHPPYLDSTHNESLQIGGEYLRCIFFYRMYGPVWGVQKSK